jgi:hypothetical protein
MTTPFSSPCRRSPGRTVRPQISAGTLMSVNAARRQRGGENVTAVAALVRIGAGFLDDEHRRLRGG